MIPPGKGDLGAVDLAPQARIERRHVPVLGAQLARKAKRSAIGLDAAPDARGGLEDENVPRLQIRSWRPRQLTRQRQARGSGSDDDAVVDVRRIARWHARRFWTSACECSGRQGNRRARE